MNKPFDLTTVFTKDAIAAIISQMQDGKEMITTAAGGKTTKLLGNYNSKKGKFVAYSENSYW